MFLNKRNNFGRVDSCNNNIAGCFCIIPLDINTGFIYNYNNTTINSRFIKQFTEIVPSLSSLDIEFVDSYGNLYDFNNQDHTLVFEIKSLTRA